MTASQFLRSTRPDRRNVRWGHPLSFIVEALPRAIEEAIAAEPLTVGALVLDYGCAEQPYRSCFGPEVRYLGADLPGNPLADIEIAEDHSVDLPDGGVDLVLSTQVLEHVHDPQGYLAECRRLLSPTGRLILSTHGLMALHRDPIDHWRWTCDGLRHVVAAAGFDVLTFRGVMGMGATGIQLFQDATILGLPRRARRPYAWLMQRAAAWVDARTDPRRRDDDAMVFLLTAAPRQP